MTLIVESKIKTLFSGLAKREKSVARVITHDYPLSALDTVSVVSDKSGVSTATVLRVVGKLGYETYGEFQDAVKQDLKIMLNQNSAAKLHTPANNKNHKALSQTDTEETSPESYHSLYQLMTDQFAQNIKHCKDRMLETDFYSVLALISNKKFNIYCIGGRVSSHIAELLAQYLSTIRSGVRFVAGQAEGWSRYLVEVDKRTVVFAYDIRSYQTSVRQFASLAKSNQAIVVLITDNWHKPTEFEPDYIFKLPSHTFSPVESLVSQLAFTETLLAGYIEKNNIDVRLRMENYEKFNHMIN